MLMAQLNLMVRILWRRKKRNFLLGLAVILGVASLVVIRSFGLGSEEDMMAQVDRFLGARAILVSSGGQGMGEWDRGQALKLKMEDLQALADEVADIEVWDPVQTTSAMVKANAVSFRLPIFGHSERAEQVWQRGVDVGRFFSAGENEARARVALLGPKAALRFFPSGNAVGQTVWIEDDPFQVIGVLAPLGFDPHGMDLDDEIHIPIETLMRRVRNVDYLRMGKLWVKPDRNVESTAESVRQVLRQRHRLGANQEDDFTLVTPQFARKLIAQMNRLFRVILPSISGLALLLAVVLIMSSLALAVRQRQKEIAIRRAVGATSNQISRLFLLEAVLLSLTSGLIGCGLAVFLLGVFQMHGAHTVLDWSAMGLGVLVSAGVGILAGWLPARRAGKLDPAVALR
ncbi:MAG: ABC transporter permease [Acidobacteria bacterium]|nr:ABC transporter permease [Acidobacteriota bacterium]